MPPGPLAQEALGIDPQREREKSSPPPSPQAQPWTGHLHSVGLLESPNLLDLIHEVATVDVLHHKIQSVLRERGRKMVEDA